MVEEIVCYLVGVVLFTAIFRQATGRWPWEIGELTRR